MILWMNSRCSPIPLVLTWQAIYAKSWIRPTRTYLGTGKVEELKVLAEELGATW